MMHAPQTCPTHPSCVNTRACRRGTRSGPYKGFASKAWLEGEMRKDVDDVAKHVDIHVTTVRGVMLLYHGVQHAE